MSFANGVEAIMKQPGENDHRDTKNNPAHFGDIRRTSVQITGLRRNREGPDKPSAERYRESRKPNREVGWIDPGDPFGSECIDLRLGHRETRQPCAPKQ